MSGAPGTYNAYLALYDGKSKLLRVDAKKIELNGSAVELEFDKPSAYETARLFIWSGMSPAAKDIRFKGTK